MKTKIRRLEIEIEALKRQNAELTATIQEMYFYGLDLVERVRMEPLEANTLRVESQTKKKGLSCVKTKHDAP